MIGYPKSFLLWKADIPSRLSLSGEYPFGRRSGGSDPSSSPPKIQGGSSLSVRLGKEILKRNRWVLESSCDFYYPDLNHEGSIKVLAPLPRGAFLLRNSSHPSYAFALSVKLQEDYVTSVRIGLHGLFFTFDSENSVRHKMSKSQNVLDLIARYCSSEKEERLNIVWVDQSSNTVVPPIYLRSPARKGVSSLKHLSRLAVHQNRLHPKSPIPQELKRYLQEYPFSL